ncbi:EamA family transporter [Candidatus Nanohaloarchaea archaeon]|nr:EamA family transporter [Candidatus Nanohaloarchaea archaeon]
MSWLAWVLASAILYSVVELFDKFVTDHEIKNYQIASIMCGIPIYLFFMAYGLISGSPLIPVTVAGVSVLLGSLYTFSLFSYYTGLSEEDVTRFIPTLSLNTVIVVILSFMILGESYDLVTYAGIASVVVGTLLISIENPRKTLRNFQSTRALHLGLITAFIGAVSSIVLKVLTNTAALESILFWEGIGGIISIIPLIYVNRTEFTLEDLNGYRDLTIIGFLTSTAYLAFAKSITLGPVSLTSTLLKINSIFIFFGATIISRLHPEIIHEELDTRILAQKIISILLIIAGVAAIKLI